MQSTTPADPHPAATRANGCARPELRRAKRDRGNDRDRRANASARARYAVRCSCVQNSVIAKGGQTRAGGARDRWRGGPSGPLEGRATRTADRVSLGAGLRTAAEPWHTCVGGEGGLFSVCGPCGGSACGVRRRVRRSLCIPGFWCSSRRNKNRRRRGTGAGARGRRRLCALFPG